MNGTETGHALVRGAEERRPGRQEDFSSANTQEVHQQRIGRDCIVKIVFQGRLTQEAVGRLIKYLELAKDTLPSEGDKDDR
jgi:hypothetical protein